MTGKSNSDERYPDLTPRLGRLYAAVWEMTQPDQGPEVLDQVVALLKALDLPFRSCVLYLASSREGGETVRYRELAVGTGWSELPEGADRARLVGVWRRGVSAVESLRAEGVSDHPLEQVLHHPVASLLEVPFSHGILGLYAAEPGAFAERHTEPAGQVALVLSALHHRLQDLDRLMAKERQLRHVQRLQLAGQLALEVAHEINNPLTVVFGECDLLLDGDLDPLLRQSITTISKASLQVQSVSNRLLEFVRGHRAEKEWLNLNRLVDDALGLLRRMLHKEGIDLQEELAHNLPWIQAHAGQLQQVVLNLVQNSRDALCGHRIQGIIKVRTMQRQSRVALEVEDNGSGIPERIRERIFEPFFTTKEGGKGTGLGLSVCAGIAREHGGELRIEPRVLGTCMVLELPIRQEGRTATN